MDIIYILRNLLHKIFGKALPAAYASKLAVAIGKYTAVITPLITFDP